jgi:hypothetical protein
MWGLLDRKAQALIVVGLAALLTMALQGLAELFTGDRPSTLKLISLVTFLITTVVVAIVNLVWRRLWRHFPSLNRLVFPDLNGQWEGTLVTTWKDENGQSPGPIAATLWIKQSLLSMHIRLQTKESTSYSSRETLEAAPSKDRYLVWYSYHNQPQRAVAYRSTPHDGVSVIEMNVDVDANRLTGQYYTARHTSGDMEFVRKS